jgi:pyruvate dehydrogenase E2 component (dihydrolipoamide acetyltransferase)
MAEFLMPILGADMVAGTLIKWRKGPGDRVDRGDVIAEVETEKGLIDVECYTTGVLERIVVEPGATVPTGTVLAIIREDVPSAAAPAAPPRAARARVSPLARKVAEQLGVDLALVPGTGAGGAVTREDVERAAAGRRGVPTPEAPAAAARPSIDPARMRQTIAAAMTRAKREIPHYYLAHTIDMGPAMAWLARENAQRPVPERLLFGVLLIKAVALALREVPELNARWRGDRVEPSRAIHVGVAISLRGGGLVAPALHDVDRQPVGELMRALRDLTQRARTGGLRSSEMSDPTITVTSLGERGVESAFGIVYPPQVAIVGFGTIRTRPWVIDGAVVPRPLITATLSADHRVSDGHRGGLFLAAVERLLQSPEAL